MIESLYSSARLYDLMYPQPSEVSTKVGFYLDLAAAARRPVLELACGTGSMLLPIAAQGIECEGVDLSSDMMAEARAKFEAEELSAPFHVGDMASFDLGRRFGLIFIASNSLLHVHAADDIVRCFQSVRTHLDHGGRFAFDVFNPSVQLLPALTERGARCDALTTRSRVRFAWTSRSATTRWRRSRVASGTSRPSGRPTSSPCPLRFGAFSRKSFPCSSRPAASDCWSGMATSRGARSRPRRRIRCASVKRPRGCARHHRRASAAVDWLRQPLSFIVIPTEMEL